MLQSLANRIASQMMLSVCVLGFMAVASFGHIDMSHVDEDNGGPLLEWYKILGDPQKNSSGKFITVDSDGSIYVAGYFKGTIDFDPGRNTYFMTSEGTKNAFVMKLDPFGQLVWAESIRGDCEGLRISVDKSGFVYVEGNKWGGDDLKLSDGTLISSIGRGVFILKFDRMGELVWGNGIEGKIGFRSSGNTKPVDSDGSIYMTGTFEGTVDFDPGPDTRNLVSNGGGDVFVLKLNQSGNLVWVKSVGGSGWDSSSSIALDDANGSIYISGTFGDMVDFDPGPDTRNLVPNGGNNLFILKLNQSGNLVWVKSVGGSGPVIGQSINVDANRDVYITGRFSGTGDFDPGPNEHYLSSENFVTQFMMKMKETGELDWAKQVYGMTSPFASYVDASGNVLVTGKFYDNVDFDPGPNEYLVEGHPLGNTYSSTYVAMYDSMGELVWVNTYLSGSWGLRPESIFANESGSVFLTGSLQGGIYNYFPNGRYTRVQSTNRNGFTSIFLFKYQPYINNVSPKFNTSSEWNTLAVEGVELYLSSLASDPDGDDITITASNPPSGLTIEGTTLTWTPDYDQAGVYDITLTADDGNGGIATATLTITVENTNRPPVANAGADIAAECADVTTAAQLDGSGSSDPDDDEITYAWSADGIEFGNATAAITTGEFPLGETTVTLTVSDGEPLDGTDTDEAVVTIVDTTPPTINYTQTATELWPPNHNMATAIEGISATDACGGDIVLAVTVSSDEDGMGGAGNTEEDWDVITVDDGSQSVALRAERSGNGDGREYTVVVTATDASGNSTEQTLTVAVPLSKGNVSDNGNGKGKGRGKEVATPLTTALYDNYPNPFNAETVIRFDVAESGPVRLDIFDITGRRIRTLVDQFYSAGSIELVWDSRDNAGNEVASGVYVYRLQTAQSSFSKRLMLLR